MAPTPVSQPISFSCSHCAMELTVPPELAGVTGPCPGCGGMIQSPAPLEAPASAPGPGQPPAPGPAPAEVAAQVVSAPRPGVREARKLAPKPRPMRARPQPEEPVGPLMEPHHSPRRSSPGSRSRPRARSIAPVTGLSTKYDERQEVGAIVRVSLAVLLTGAIVVAVFVFLSGR